MMQGQDGTSEAFPGTYYLNYGSNGINLQWDQNNAMPSDGLFHDGIPLIDWLGQSSSSASSQTSVGLQDLLVENELPSSRIYQYASSMNAQSRVQFPELVAEDCSISSSVTRAVMDQSLVERHSDPIVPPFQPSADMNLVNSHLINRPFSFQHTGSSALSEIIDLNGTCEGQGIEAYLNTADCAVGSYMTNGTGLCMNPFKPGRSDGNQNPFVVDSSNSDPLFISSGIAGYVVEESDSREGCPSDGRRLSCKRRAPEDDCRLLPSGASSESRSSNMSVTTHENGSRRLNLRDPISNRQNVHYPEQLASGLGSGEGPVVRQPLNAARSGFGLGVGANSDVHQTLRVVGEVENSNRNIRMRRTVNNQDFAPADGAVRTRRNSYTQLPGQPSALFPFDSVPNRSVVTGISHSNPVSQSVHASNSLEALQPFQWNAVTRERTGPLSTAYTSNGGDALLLEENSMHGAYSGTLPSGIPRRNLEHMNLNFVPGTNSSVNAASGSRNTCTHPFLAPIVFRQGNTARNYAQRLSDSVNRMELQGQRNLGASLAARERELSARHGSARPSQNPLRSGLLARGERQFGVHPIVAFNSLTIAQRRSRLISEVRNALALVRRGGSLHFEDVMVIDRSVLYGVPEEPDVLEDMRLDVDNMTYEELLALEEHIGNVSTGLSEDVIQLHMKRKKYQVNEVKSPRADEPCSICQEQYVDGQDLGKLDCGHDFHFNCIKQWLIQKNSCPICKTTALEVEDSEN
ncbi:probable E3 ubiquitin-protein ligase HIP1 [Mercurialis annua]|uniref:probable E3 ubiquitin-protein ligase HIP1 n=1 Tax=Mercurialis annua TaxID=3986 RepID=UPI00215FAA9B|nr:probable E3 ubiquitin-protein ligase HIP1 [Mercurialis annua]XP_050206181.1 probable E3 ubiquitin-protein ligase HIP1 [Mercurialis annua]XP_050206182.1 probable E3 ubiquitin-protein ligase HIP1 [Mercurialis annua]